MGKLAKKMGFVSSTWRELSALLFGDDLEVIGETVSSLPLFFWRRRSHGALICFVVLPTIFKFD